MGFVIPRPVVRRTIMVLVSVAMLALTLISLAGMSASVLVVESTRGNVRLDTIFIDEGFESLSPGDILTAVVDEAGDYDLWGRIA